MDIQERLRKILSGVIDSTEGATNVRLEMETVARVLDACFEGICELNFDTSKVITSYTDDVSFELNVDGLNIPLFKSK